LYAGSVREGEPAGRVLQLILYLLSDRTTGDAVAPGGRLRPRASVVGRKTLDQRLSGERAWRLLGWTPSAPSVFEELERGSYS